jgi:hypothetical protein
MCEIVVDAGTRVPLRHPHHSADERLQHYAAGKPISNRNLGQQGSKDGIGVPLGSGEHIVERPARGQRVMPISPVWDGSAVITHKLAPLSIERRCDAGSTPPPRCARHSDDLVRPVLSTVLAETLLVLPIWALCCQ